MRERGKRVQWLIDQAVVFGRMPDEIDRLDEKRKKFGQRVREKGDRSVGIVGEALLGMKNEVVSVEKYTPTEPESKLDTKGKADALASVRVVGLSYLLTIKIQVKSGEKGRKAFLGHFYDEEEDEAWVRFAKKMLVLLRSDLNRGDIQKHFLKQLERILEVKFDMKLKLVPDPNP